jgi:hypothetical protein
MTNELYLELRAKVVSKFPDEFERIQRIKPSQTSEELWRRYMYVVCNSGMAWKVAKDIVERIEKNRDEGLPATSGFRHKGKTAAIDKFWDDRKKISMNFLNWTLITRRKSSNGVKNLSGWGEEQLAISRGI